MSLGLSALVQVYEQTPKSQPPKQKSTHRVRAAEDAASSCASAEPLAGVKSAAPTAVGKKEAKTLGNSHAPPSRPAAQRGPLNSLRNSLRNSLLPITPTSGKQKPATTSGLSNSLRKSLLPIAQLAAPHTPLETSKSQPPKQKSAHSQRVMGSSELATQTSGRPKSAPTSGLGNSLRKSLLPIAQLAAPHYSLRSSSPATLPQATLPVTPTSGKQKPAPTSGLSNSLRKSLLPIAQLAAPGTQLRSSSPAALPEGKRFRGRPSGQAAPGGEASVPR